MRPEKHNTKQHSKHLAYLEFLESKSIMAHLYLHNLSCALVRPITIERVVQIKINQ